MKTKIKVKVIGVPGLFSSHQVNKEPVFKQILHVIEVPDMNPFGRDYETNSIPFDIEVHNANVAKFGVGSSSLNEHADVELIIKPLKDSKVQYLVNSLEWVV